MSKDITDIANWKDDYLFLKNIWDIYNEYDNTVENNTNNHQIYSLCDIILTTLSENKDKFNNFCTKLLRNLGHYSENLKFFIHNYDSCDILYNWIYNSKKKHAIPDTIIQKGFEEYVKIGDVMKYKFSCSYDTYNSLYKEPINITLLNIFEYNMETIRNTFNDEKSVNNIPCRKLVCKTVKIYNDMYKKYCDNAIDGYEKHTDTCSKLNLFYSTYNFYFLKNIVKKDQIPSLDDEPKIYSMKCQKYVEEQALHKMGVDENSPTYSKTTLTQDKNQHAAAPIITHEGDNKGSLMSPTVSTTLGTVAGASSILALLYKFTPGRNWIRSGISGNRGRINSNFHAEEPNHLLFNGMEHNDFNSYSIGYEAM
ncbi:VIR protein [Plasmodium vivax]|uniref:VIR protein n=1 Tax=Plasmodium vivax TaxID=5855 RepID=A0A1G4GSB0_PLAVI|nr:VIR protein [Plasmodium vivax]